MKRFKTLGKFLQYKQKTEHAEKLRFLSHIFWINYILFVTDVQIVSRQIRYIVLTIFSLEIDVYILNYLFLILRHKTSSTWHITRILSLNDMLMQRSTISLVTNKSTLLFESNLNNSTVISFVYEDADGIVFQPEGSKLLRKEGTVFTKMSLCRH